MKVENFWDELWLGVKSQSYQEIAGSPRNSFRVSLYIVFWLYSTENVRGSQILPIVLKLGMPKNDYMESDCG